MAENDGLRQRRGGDNGNKVKAAGGGGEEKRDGKNDGGVVGGWMVWMKEESHEMMLPMVSFLPDVAAAKNNEAKLETRFIKRNPVYWCGWLATAGMLGGGRAVHGLLGQHGPVRPDESEAEHEIRVQWIYANDCTYAASLLSDLWTMAKEVNILLFHRHVLDGHHQAVGTLIGFSLLGMTVLGNAAFYDAMRRRSTTGVRASVAGNAGFAFVMSVALAAAARRKGLGLLKFSWFMRVVTVVFAIMALPSYAKLWKGYADSGTQDPSRRTTLAAAALPFLGVTAIMVLAFKLDHHAVWETFG